MKVCYAPKLKRQWTYTARLYIHWDISYLLVSYIVFTINICIHDLDTQPTEPHIETMMIVFICGSSIDAALL